jgi:nucleoside-diphosphate-sugar epimerase
LFGTGAQMRNLLFADDACDAMLRAAREPALHGQAMFVAHDTHVSVADIARQIVTTMGRGTVVHVEWPEERKRIEVDDVQISSSRFRELTNWSPKRSLVEGLEITRATLEATT